MFQKADPYICNWEKCGYFTKNYNFACMVSSLILKRVFWILIEKTDCCNINSTMGNNLDKFFSMLLKHFT